MVQKRTVSDIIADTLIYILLTSMIVVTIYPVLYILSTSISDSVLVSQNKIVLLPRGINFGAYETVFMMKTIWNAFGVSVFVLFVGTAINVTLNICAAFPLSRQHFAFRKTFMMMIIITMFFSGGMIPTYLVVDTLGLTDTIWALIIPTAISAFNVIIMRTFFETIPDSLEESVKIDGGTDFDVLINVFIPLSTPVIAVIALYYAVEQWNSFTAALIYIRKLALYPLQLVLRGLLLQNQSQAVASTADNNSDLLGATRSVQYAIIIISILPMLIIYPFLQRYFVKGIMIGALKG